MPHWFEDPKELRAAVSELTEAKRAGRIPVAEGSSLKGWWAKIGGMPPSLWPHAVTPEQLRADCAPDFEVRVLTEEEARLEIYPPHAVWWEEAAAITERAWLTLNTRGQVTLEYRFRANAYPYVGIDWAAGYAPAPAVPEIPIRETLARIPNREAAGNPPFRETAIVRCIRGASPQPPGVGWVGPEAPPPPPGVVAHEPRVGLVRRVRGAPARLARKHQRLSPGAVPRRAQFFHDAPIRQERRPAVSTVHRATPRILSPQ